MSHIIVATENCGIYPMYLTVVPSQASSCVLSLHVAKCLPPTARGSCYRAIFAVERLCMHAGGHVLVRKGRAARHGSAAVIGILKKGVKTGLECRQRCSMTPSKHLGASTTPRLTRQCGHE